LAARIPSKGSIVYVAPDRSFHPLGLLPYGARIEQWIHISARRSEDRAWTVLEALRCPQVSAVLAVLNRADLTYCRRLQLATETSGATGFLLGDIHSAPAASVITRWQVSSIVAPQGRGLDELFWALDLLYCRGAQPRKWIATWHHQRLEILSSIPESGNRLDPATNLRKEAAVAG
jgi:protein ImuA